MYSPFHTGYKDGGMDQARVRETENLPTQPLSVVVAIATIFTDLSYIATVKEKAAANVTVFLWGHLHSCSEVCVFTVRPSVREPVTIFAHLSLIRLSMATCRLSRSLSPQFSLVRLARRERGDSR